MDNLNDREITFEEAVNAISEQNNDDGSTRHDKELKKTVKDDTNNRIPTMGFFRNW